MITPVRFVLHNEVSVYQEAKDEFAGHKEAFVHVQSQFMSIPLLDESVWKKQTCSRIYDILPGMRRYL